MADVMTRKAAKHNISDVEQRVEHNRIIWRERGCLYIVICYFFPGSYFYERHWTLENARVESILFRFRTWAILWCFGHAVKVNI